MPIDRPAAEEFVWSAARLLDRHRFAFLFHAGPAAPVLDALRAYRNPDGGFGHALEPDLRTPVSQPAATLTALEVLEEVGAAGGELGAGARAWLAAVAGPDGGIPFAVAGFEGYPHAPWWETGPLASFLTFMLAGACHASGVAGDAWLDRATEWSWRAIETETAPSPYWLKAACAFLDAVPDEDRARSAVVGLGTRVDLDALAPPGGTEGEVLRPLDLSPRPGSRSRALVGEDRIAAHLDLVEAGQQEDGGWMFDWRAWSPAQTTDWRGVVTIRALIWLRDHGRLGVTPA